MIFTDEDFKELSALFTDAYQGYNPSKYEIPNGDGNVDYGKKYLHIALKYNPPEFALRHLARAHLEACKVADFFGVRDEFYPRIKNGTLRILHYPAGSGTKAHKDFDLFTLNCYRSSPKDLEQIVDGRWTNESFNTHIGEIGEIVGMGEAVTHRVLGRPYVQNAIVYFAMPNNDSILPGKKVSSWLDERYARSRTYK